MLWQHMVTPGAILLLFGGYKMLVFLLVFFSKKSYDYGTLDFTGSYYRAPFRFSKRTTM